MVSFSGMAQVMDWPQRPPLVASCDRARVLQTWAPFCHGLAPRQHLVPFAEVRNMSPDEFVHVLANDLQVTVSLPQGGCVHLPLRGLVSNGCISM